MFFTGTLQEGISTALQKSKLVACFVTDGQEESTTWETQYLTDERIAPALAKEAVVLRLAAGSEEAGYLAAIFPLPKIPALVVIRNGTLKEYVAAGAGKDEFVTRVAGAVAGGAQPELQAQGGGESTVANAPPVVQSEASAPPVAAVQQPPAASSTATTTTNETSGQEATTIAPGTASPEHVSNEGERRRQAARKERERIERERAQRRKEKGKMPAADGGGGGGGDEKGGQEDPSKAKHNESVKKASQQLAEKQRQAREERARVLKRIADDKAERKAREERRKAEREAGRSAALSEFAAASQQQQQQQDTAAAPSSALQRRHDQCALQVRLFDGSTIRTRLPAKATVAHDVRAWVDEARTDGKDPYTFKVILTPRPNRAIDHAAEEDQTLQELGLTPSATLVLTPVDRYATAYTNVNAGLGNPVSRFVTAVLAFVVNILGGIAGALGGGGGRAARGVDGPGEENAGHELSSSSSSSAQAQTTGRDGGGRIQGFQNPDDRRKDYQLYNGNSVSATYHGAQFYTTHANNSQLNFEPRKDEEEKDK